MIQWLASYNISIVLCIDANFSGKSRVSPSIKSRVWIEEPKVWKYTELSNKNKKKGIPTIFISRKVPWISNKKKKLNSVIGSLFLNPSHERLFM